jgi:hypothetical protein
MAGTPLKQMDEQEISPRILKTPSIGGEGSRKKQPWVQALKLLPVSQKHPEPK